MKKKKKKKKKSQWQIKNITPLPPLSFHTRPTQPYNVPHPLPLGSIYALFYFDVIHILTSHLLHNRKRAKLEKFFFFLNSHLIFPSNIIFVFHLIWIEQPPLPLLIVFRKGFWSKGRKAGARVVPPVSTLTGLSSIPWINFFRCHHFDNRKFLLLASDKVKQPIPWSCKDVESSFGTKRKRRFAAERAEHGVSGESSMYL